MPFALYGWSLDLRELTSPRFKSLLMSLLFKANSIFYGQIYENVLLLHGLLEELGNKASNLCNSALISCLDDNEEALNVVPSDTDKNFF